MNELPTPSRVLVEMCIGSADDALIAAAAGADRLELCSALMLGGLTPSVGTIAEVKSLVSIPVMVMIRPRAGGFCYSENDFAVMLRDASAARDQGADGLVFGVLTEAGEIDLPRTRQLVEIAGPCQTVFHRAFDVTPDPHRALEQLIDLGVTRLLTSGQEATTYNGSALIHDLIKQAGNRIEVLPGGGIDRFNLDDILKRTGARQIHIGASRQERDPSVNHRPQVFFGGSLKPAEDRYRITDHAVALDLIERARGSAS